MRKLNAYLVVAFVLMLGACAASPVSISPTYVSPTAYQGFSCEQLTTEAQALSYRYAQLNTELTNRQQRDVAAVGVGAAVAWPALLLTQGHSAPIEVEYAQVQGALATVNRVLTDRRCAASTISEEIAASLAKARAESPAELPSAQVRVDAKEKE